MPFAKIIGSVKKIGLHRNFPWFFLDLKFDIFPPWTHEFKEEKYETSNEEKIVKSLIKHCLKHTNRKLHKKEYFDVMYKS